MNPLVNELLAVLPIGMKAPKEMVDLYEWIYDNGNIVKNPKMTVGNLGSKGVTSIEFSAEGNKNLKYWFRHDRKEVLDRLCVFCRTGADGSMGAFWLAPDGTQKIVHLGSGSGSIMVCILADNFIDFLRLLAIGYFEIAWEDVFEKVPEDAIGQDGIKYSNWVCEKFNVHIPGVGSEIVKNISLMGELDSTDQFFNWISAAI